MTKKVYNIILNSSDATSYSGTRDNANYFIDFTNIMSGDALKSAFLVTVRIKSLVMTSAYYNPANNLVVCRLGITSPFHNMNNMNWSNILGVVTFEWEGQPTSATNNYSIDTTPSSNPPVYIDNLNMISSLSLQFFDVANNASFASISNYVAILSFQEI